jgi:hypothetical protein
MQLLQDLWNRDGQVVHSECPMSLVKVAKVVKVVANGTLGMCHIKKSSTGDDW